MSRARFAALAALAALLLAGCSMGLPVGGHSALASHGGACEHRLLLGYRCGAPAPRRSHRLRHGVLCGFHGWRVLEDLRHHHPGWSMFQLWRAAHHCGRVL